MTKDIAVIGVDIGAMSLKAALIEKKADEMRCLGIHVVKFPEGEPVTENHIQAVLKEVAAKFGKKTTLAALVSSEREVQLKFVDKPPMSRENLELVLMNELHASLSNPEESKEMGFAYSIVGVTKDTNTASVQILTAAFPLATIRNQVDNFKKAGLKLIGVFPFATAARDCFLANYQEEIRDLESPYLIALINFGANSNQVSVCDKQMLRLARSFPFAGEELTKSLAKTYKVESQEVVLDRNMAEVYKSTVGILNEAETSGYGTGAVEVQVSELIRRGLDRMTQKLRLSLDYFKGQMKTQVSRAYIFGGGANLRGLLDNLGGLLLVNEIHELSPFNKILFAPENPDEAEPPMEFKSLAALALGAGICALQPDETSLNLMAAIRADRTRKIKEFAVKFVLPVAMILSVLLVPGFYWWQVFQPVNKRLADLQTENVKLTSEFLTVSKYKNEFDQLVKKQQDLKIRSIFIQNITRRKLFWSQVLLDIQSVVPKEVWLTELTSSAFGSGDSGQGAGGGQGAGAGQGAGGGQPQAAASGPGGESLKISGRSQTFAALSAFLKNMESSPSFRGLVWKESKRESSGEIVFSVTCNVAQVAKKP